MIDPPVPPKTIAVILGAQAWPLMNGALTKSNSFSLSALAFQDYLKDKNGLNLPEGAIKWMFDSSKSKDEIDDEIGQFISNHYDEHVPHFENLIFYYTGHGDFTKPDQYFQMILASTRHGNVNYSGYQMRQLAATVNRTARAARKFIILDCCYAAAAFSAWQFQNDKSVKPKIGLEAQEAFVAQSDGSKISSESGTVLICACDQEKWALYKDDQPTMFSNGLLQALHQGAVGYKDMLSIRDVYEITRDSIMKQHNNDAVAPVLHVPTGQAEFILSTPLFPNPALRQELRPIDMPKDSQEVFFKREGSIKIQKASALLHPIKIALELTLAITVICSSVYYAATNVGWIAAYFDKPTVTNTLSSFEALLQAIQRPRVVR